ncbi:MAG: S8 family serine peptidase [Candidatus Marinimicrobia bacterium]|nr:S8 family serine peptidase [Candidatus Neomarinimicrobiota bacterium]
MKKYVIIAGLLCSFLISKDEHIRQDAILFCLKPHVSTLEITRNNSLVSVNHPEIDKILSSLKVVDIQPWIRGTSENDHDGDIYLNRIYRVILSTQNRAELDNQKSQFDSVIDILSTEYEFIRKPFFTPNDSQYGQQWFLPQINSNDAWDLWDISGGEIPGNESILLASVDTGVDWDHPDLRNNMWNNLGEDADGDGVTMVQVGNTWVFDPDDQNYIDDDGNGFIDDFIGWDCSSISGGSDNDPVPPSGVSSGGTWAHGTHVAGLLAATTNNGTGIASSAFNCSIMAVKVSTSEQSYPYITDGYDGILYAAKAGYYAGQSTIINNSWGGTGYSQYEQATINIAHEDYNAIVLAAGGNGDDNSWGEIEQSHYPSSYDNVISVCPIGNNDQWNHWGTYHPTIDLASPGESIRSTKIGTGYATWDGSSMATPIVGSVIGLMKSFNPSWNQEQLITMVLSTADPVIYDVNTEGYLQGKLGKGRIDALAAVTTDLFPRLEFIDIDISILDDTNGEINQGESVELRTILFNDPEWGTGYNIEGTLVLPENAEGISILSQNADFGNASPGDAVMNEAEPFIIEFDANASLGELEFSLNIISNENGYIKNHQVLPIILSVTEQSVMMGDLNQDAIVNILDIVQIVNIILGSTPTPHQLLAGDLNSDGVINVLDIVNIVNIILSDQ